MAEAMLSGTVEVYTFKDGLLARAAHDLRLRLERFEVRQVDDRVEGIFQTDSLRVDAALVDGLPSTELSAKDRRQIEENVRDKVLNAQEHPTARFQGRSTTTGDTLEVHGTLLLHGRSGTLGFQARRDGQRYRGEIWIVPSQYGIPPFKALLGAIRLQDRVKVSFDLG